MTTLTVMRTWLVTVILLAVYHAVTLGLKGDYTACVLATVMGLWLGFALAMMDDLEQNRKLRLATYREDVWARRDSEEL